jgi:outer membrane beta-barrel protein
MADNAKFFILPCLGLGILAIFFALLPASASGQEEETGGTVALRTITVEPERPNWEKILSPGAVSVVVPDDFKGEQKNLGDMLDQVPGLQVQRITGTGQYTTVRVRGSTAAQVNVYVDGVLQNVGNDMAVDISLIPVSQVARVEVYRGYVPVRFAGSPIGGVINVVTKKADRLGVTAEAGVKSLGGQVYNLTATAPTFWDGSVLIGAHKDESDGDFEFTKGPYYSQVGDSGGQMYSPNGDVVTRKRMHNKYENQDFLLKWQNDNFSLKGAYKETVRALPEPASYQRDVITDRSGNVYDFFREQDANQTELVAGYRNTWGDLDLGLQFFNMKQNKDTHFNDLPVTMLNAWGLFGIFPGALWQKRETDKHGIQADTSYNLGERHLFELHADYSQEVLHVDANPMTSGDGTVLRIHEDMNYWPKYQEERSHLQAQDTITLGNDDSTKLTLIGRMDKVRSAGNLRDDASWRKSWGTALVKDVTTIFSFRATMGTFNRYPNFSERFGDGIYVMPSWTMKNPNTRDLWGNFTWEKGEQWDIGLDWNGPILEAKNRTSLSYFNRYTENMMQMYNNFAFSYFENTARGQVDGLEFETHFNWARFDLDFSSTWQHGRSSLHRPWPRGSTDMGYAGLTEKMTGLPEWEYFVRGNYRLPGDSLSLFAEYHYTDSTLRRGDAPDMSAYDPRSDSPIFVNGDVYADPLGLINAGLRWQITDQLSAVAGVNDLLNDGSKQGTHIVSSLGSSPYSSIIDYPREGRTYLATLRYEFGGHESAFTQKSASADGDFSHIKEQGEDGSFYIAPKFIHSKFKTRLSGETLTFGGGQNGTGWRQIEEGCFSPGCSPPDYYQDWTYYTMTPGSSFDIPVLGGQSGQTSDVGGLALGFDLYKLNGLPLRLELEGSLHNRQDVTYQTYEYHKKFTAADPYPYINVLHSVSSVQYLQSKSASLLFNAFLDLHNSTRFTPYIGAGLGATRYNHKITELVDFRYGDQSLISSGFDVGPPMVSSAEYTRPFDNRYSNPGSNSPKTTRTETGWALTWNLAAGFSYQLSPSTYLDFGYRYMDFGKQNLPTAAPAALRSEINAPGIAPPVGSVMAYGSGTGQTLESSAHQALLTLRYDLGAGEEAIAAYNRKKEGGLSIFDGFSGPGPLDGPAIKPGSFTVSPRFGGWFPSSDFAMKNGYLGGLGLGYNITQKWGVEASYEMTNRVSTDYAESSFRNGVEARYSGQARIGSVRLNALCHLLDPENENSRWVPYATAGLGQVWSKGHFQNNEAYRSGDHLQLDPSTNGYQQQTGNYSSFAVNGGLGVKYFLTENVALRLEALDTYAFKDAPFGRATGGPYHNLSFTGGLVFQFGGS